jgi:hypothetical protein
MMVHIVSKQFLWELLYIKGMPLYTSPSFRHGLPESRLQGRIELTVHGPGFGHCSCVALTLSIDHPLVVASVQSTRFPAGMTTFVYNGIH